MHSQIQEAHAQAIQNAGAIIRRGGLVAFPTETVYGLGANALDGLAVARIFETKGRPAFNPLISHFTALDQIAAHGYIDDRVRLLDAHFWPGPLTLIIPRLKTCGISELVTSGLDTIAVRIPAHKVAQGLIMAAGVPLAAPSANKSGSVSPTAPAHVAESLGTGVDLILASGACSVGLESTILDISESEPVILRPGAITAEDIAAVLGREVGYNIAANSEAPKSPGQLLKHYAPSIAIRLRAIDILPGEALLGFGSLKFMSVRGKGSVNELPEHSLRNLSESGDLHQAAANLFLMMRELDIASHSGIAVMDIPETGLGIAINDRLRRAAHA